MHSRRYIHNFSLFISCSFSHLSFTHCYFSEYKCQILETRDVYNFNPPPSFCVYGSRRPRESDRSLTAFDGARSLFDYRSIARYLARYFGDPGVTDRRLTRVMLAHLLPDPCASTDVCGTRVHACVHTREYSRPPDLGVRGYTKFASELLSKDLVSYFSYRFAIHIYHQCFPSFCRLANRRLGGGFRTYQNFYRYIAC